MMARWGDGGRRGWWYGDVGCGDSVVVLVASSVIGILQKLMVTVVVQLRLSRGGGDSDVVVRRWRGMNGGEVNVGSAVVE
ncbi:hypothetical protein Tco_0771633 [Tanacetum coccineum]|uniref:Transmembrane protein n=1 Tax=Tanacetum coccineum TaxID=301880 RepID=A0ABQ4ZGP2_9ASTR